MPHGKNIFTTDDQYWDIAFILSILNYWILQINGLKFILNFLMLTYIYNILVSCLQRSQFFTRSLCFLKYAKEFKSKYNIFRHTNAHNLCEVKLALIILMLDGFPCSPYSSCGVKQPMYYWKEHFFPTVSM